MQTQQRVVVSLTLNPKPYTLNSPS
jgi:hypothetical protein